LICYAGIGSLVTIDVCRVATKYRTIVRIIINVRREFYDTDVYTVLQKEDETHSNLSHLFQRIW